MIDSLAVCLPLFQEEACNGHSNRFALHLRFRTLAIFCQDYLSDIPGRQGKRQRQRVRRVIRSQIQELLRTQSQNPTVYELDTCPYFLLTSSQQQPSSLSFRRIHLQAFQKGLLTHGHSFQHLTHLTIEVTSQWSSSTPHCDPLFRFPSTLRHFHLSPSHTGFYHLWGATKNFPLEWFPDQLECLDFVEDHSGFVGLSNSSFASQIRQRENDWEVFLLRCSGLRKIKLYGRSLSHWPPGLFDHPSLERCDCYDLDRSENPASFSPPWERNQSRKKDQQTSVSRLRHLTLPGSSLDPEKMLSLSRFPHLITLNLESRMHSRRLNTITPSCLASLPMPALSWETGSWLQTLVLPNNFDGSLSSCKNLLHLRRLRLGHSFNTPIGRDHWPPLLQCLVICSVPTMRLFPRDDLEDLDLFNSATSSFQHTFDFLPASLSILLVGKRYECFRSEKLKIIRDHRYPHCRICAEPPSDI